MKIKPGSKARSSGGAISEGRPWRRDLSGMILAARSRRRDLAGTSGVGHDLAHSLCSLFLLSLSLWVSVIRK